jgi:hypothetical protein
MKGEVNLVIALTRQTAGQKCVEVLALGLEHENFALESQVVEPNDGL